MSEKGSAILVLEDGTVYKGKAIGKIGTTGGEIAFNTGMTGYQEVFTDPSYYGQLLIMTTAHIGNYGTQSNEQESDKINISGLITKKFSDGFSRTSGDQSLQDFMVHHETVGISDIDTRALVSYIRENGAMNAVISTEVESIEKLKEQLSKTPNMDGLELASVVSTKEPYFYGNKEATYKVAALDIGIKKNILRRDGAMPSEYICISKEVGRGARGLKDLKNNILDSPYIKDYLRPLPKIELGKKIANKILNS